MAIKDDSVAQLVEHIPFKDGVLGPNPSWVTKLNQERSLRLLFFFIFSDAMYTVYILYSSSIDKFYVGYTNDLTRRFTEHNRKKGKFTDQGIPWKIVRKEDYELKSEAMDREKFIKAQKSRKFILSLISTSDGRAFR